MDIVLQLKYWILSAIKISLLAPPDEVVFGHPLSYLIHCAADEGAEKLASRMLELNPREFYLNGTGFKLLLDVRVIPDSTHRRLVLKLVNTHPEGTYCTTISRLEQDIRERQLHDW
jgi:hypothetical protein